MRRNLSMIQQTTTNRTAATVYQSWIEPKTALLMRSVLSDLQNIGLGFLREYFALLLKEKYSRFEYQQLINESGLAFRQPSSVLRGGVRTLKIVPKRNTTN